MNSSKISINLLSVKIYIFLVMSLFAFLPAAYASHEVGAAVYWTRGATDEQGNVTVNFDAYFAYEQFSSFSENFYFGDGNSDSIGNGPFSVVFSGARPNGDAYYIGKTTLSHVYSAEAIAAYGAAFYAGFDSGCRVDGIANGINGNCDIFAKAIVDLSSSANLGSATSIAPLAFPAKAGSLLDFTLPISSPDADPVKCKLANANLIDYSVPQIAGASLSITEDCKINWDLSSATASDFGKIFVVQVQFEDRNHPVNYFPDSEQQQAPLVVPTPGSNLNFTAPSGDTKPGFSSGVVDFIVEIVDPQVSVGLTCTTDAPTFKEVAPGQSAQFTYNCVADLPQQPQFDFIDQGSSSSSSQESGPQIKIYTFGGPSDATFIPVSGTTGPSPFNASFSWTADASDAGKNFPLFVLFSLPGEARQGEGLVAPGQAAVQVGSPSFVAFFPTVLSVPLNAPPVCTIGGAVETSCVGSNTIASASISTNATDADSSPLTLQWGIQCPSSLSNKVSVSGANTTSFGLTFDVNTLTSTEVCSLTFVASDGNSNATCSSSVTVKPCDKDCAGIANGTTKVDRCGVCGGNGQSCLGCTAIETKPFLAALDGNASVAESLVVHAAKLLKSDKNVAVSKRNSLAKKLIAEANASYISAWGQVWTIPQSITSCSNTSLCVQTSYVSTLSVVNNEMTAFGAQLQKALKAAKSKGVKSKISALIASFNKINAQSVSSLLAIPSASSC